jgi:hypothetical protein
MNQVAVWGIWSSSIEGSMAANIVTLRYHICGKKTSTKMERRRPFRSASGGRAGRGAGQKNRHRVLHRVLLCCENTNDLFVFAERCGIISLNECKR